MANVFHLPAPRLAQDAGAGRTFRILLLLGAVAILNGVDLLYTLFASRIHILNEVNPIAAVFIQQGLVSSLVSFKILMVVCGLGMLWKLRASHWTVPACWTLLIAYTYLGVIWYQWVCAVNSMYETTLVNASR